MNLDVAPRRQGFFTKKELTRSHKISRAEMREDMAILETLDKKSAEKSY